MADAAAVTSLIARSVVGDFGSTGRPTRAAAGISSCSSPSCFDPSSVTKKFTPVALPPGRLWLATRPNGTGSWLTPKTMGIVMVAALAANATCSPPVVAIASEVRSNLTQELQALGCEIGGNESHARDVASGTGEARHKAGLNRIVTHRHDDRYRVGRDPSRWCYVATECKY